MSETPVFVKMDNYKEVVEVVNMIKSKIEDAKRTLSKISELRNEEGAEVDLWHTTIEEIQKKVELVDRTLAEPETI